MCYTPANSMFETQIPITYLPTGDIDTTLTSSQNLASANTLLAPTITLIREVVGDPTSTYGLYSTGLSSAIIGFSYTTLDLSHPRITIIPQRSYQISRIQSSILRETTSLSMTLFSIFTLLIYSTQSFHFLKPTTQIW